MKNRIFIFSIAIILLAYSCSTKPKWQDYREGTQVVVEIEKTDDDIKDGMNQLRVNYLLNQRLREYGIKGFLSKNVDDNKIYLQFSKKVNLDEKLRGIIVKPYLLKFKIVNEQYSLDDIDLNSIPPDVEILRQNKNSSNK